MEKIMTIKSYIRMYLFLITSISLLACSGGNDSATVEQQGQFIDSVVSGLRYETTSTSGFTDTQGAFSYQNGEFIRFYVGDIFIGGALGQAIITPVELVTGAIDESSTQVQNIAMFLQTIDDDGNEANGINITQLANAAAQGQAIDFSLTSGVFEIDGAIQTLISNITSANGNARAMVSRTQASSSLATNLVGLLAGDYQGNFSGDDTGTWTANVNTNGGISGIRRSDNFGDASIAGSVSSSGLSTISGTIDTVVFSGLFIRSGNVSGTWIDDDGTSGIFTGNRISTAPIPGNGEPTPAPINNFGSLSISGIDANNIGTTYTPNLDPVIIKDTLFNTGTVTVNWSQSIFSNNEFESRSMTFRFNEKDGSLYSVIYIRLTGNNPGDEPTSFFSYFVDCEDDPQSCLSMDLDVMQQQITFTNTSLVIDMGNNNATDIISLNGLLSW